MFIFQGISQKPAETKKTLENMEKELVQSNSKNPAGLMSFLASVQKFAAANPDAKSQAFCCQAGVWLAEHGVKDASIVALLDIGKSTDASLKSAAFHYQNYFAAVNASRSSDGTVALSIPAIYKLTEILDKAQRNILVEQESSITTEKGRYYFLFATRAQADEFATSVLGALPAKFNPIVGTTADLLGKEYVQSKGVANNPYAVEFTCEYTDKFPAPGADASLKAKSTGFMPQSTILDRRLNITRIMRGETKAYDDAAIKDYASRGIFQTSASADGQFEISGKASLFYAPKYIIDPIRDAKSAKDLATEAFKQLLKEYAIEFEEPLESFLLGEKGQKALAILNKNALNIQGWASMEVFAVMAGGACSNYEVLKKAIIDNWQLAHDRTSLIFSYIQKLNDSISKANKGLPPDKQLSNIKISESDLNPNLYFFQNLPPKLMERLIADKDISKNTALRDWLNVYKGAQNGEEHMGQLLSYLQQKGGGKNAEYTKIKAALDGKDSARLNRYWQRTQNDSLGMRNESRNSQSLLVQAIENSGNGKSRSTMISSLSQAHIGVEIERINYDLELDKGEKCTVEVGIKESRPVQDIGMKIHACLVGTDGKSIPLIKQPNGKYSCDVGAPGVYTFVGYAQSDNCKISTPLVGTKIKVTEKPSPPPPTIARPWKYVQASGNNINIASQPTTLKFRIPSVLMGSDQFVNMSAWNENIIPLYAALGIAPDQFANFNKGQFENISGEGAVNFFASMPLAIDKWLNSIVDFTAPDGKVSKMSTREIIQTYYLKSEYLGSEKEEKMEEFITAMQNCKFETAQSYLNSDASASGGFSRSFKDMLVSQLVTGNLTPNQLSRFIKFRWFAQGGVTINLQQPKLACNPFSDKESFKDYIASEGLETINDGVSRLRKTNDQIILRGKENRKKYGAVMGENGSVSLYELPKTPAFLHIYLQQDGNLLMTDTLVTTNTAGATLSAAIQPEFKVGTLKLNQLEIIPYLDVRASQQVASASSYYLYKPDPSPTITGMATAGTKAKIPLYKFIHGLLEANVSGSYNDKQHAKIQGTIGAGVGISNEKLDAELVINRTLSDGAPDDWLSANVRLQKGKKQYAVQAGRSLAKGSNAYSVGVSFEYMMY